MTGKIVAAIASVAVPAVVLIAQMDAISGNAGWAGAGLLGLVLGWLLLKHLPDKDRMIREIIHEHAVSEKEMLAAFQAQLDRTRQDFTASLRYMVDKTEVNNRELIATLHREFEHICLPQRKKQEHGIE